MRRQTAVAAVAPADDPIHLLTPEERAALRGIASGAIVRAAVAGALSGLASAVAAIMAHRAYPLEGLHKHADHFVVYWAWVGGVTIIASILEIGFLYWDALRSVHRMACAAGLKLGSGEGSNSQVDVMSALARAALELPNPLTPQAGIDPRREATAALIVLASLLYKAKIALTTFLLKALVRSALGRAAARTLLELIAVPVTALWNAVVCHYVLREALLRIFGPSAVFELLDAVAAKDRISAQGWQVAVRAVASAVVRTRDFHPNHLAVLVALSQKAASSDLEQVDDTRRFLQELERLVPEEQSFVLHVLVTAAILDGRMTLAEKRLLKQAFAACGREPDFRTLKVAVRTFRSGKPVIDAVRDVVEGTQAERVQSLA